MGSAPVGGESGSREAALVELREWRPAWVSSSPIRFSMSAKVGRLCAVTAVLELSIIVRHFYGCWFRAGFHRNDCSMAGPIRQRELIACIATQRPGSLQKMLVFGRNGTPGLDARQRFTLKIFSSRAGEPTCIDSICRGKAYDLLK